jgi:hypothetical protein
MTSADARCYLSRWQNIDQIGQNPPDESLAKYQSKFKPVAGKYCAVQALSKLRSTPQGVGDGETTMFKRDFGMNVLSR